MIGSAALVRGRGAVQSDDGVVAPFDRPAPAGGGGQAVEGAATGPARSAAGDDGDWLTLSPVPEPATEESGLSTPWKPAKSAGGGAAMAPRGGSGTGAAIAPVRGQVTPFRVPAPQQAAGGGGAGSSAALTGGAGRIGPAGRRAGGPAALRAPRPRVGRRPAGPVQTPAAAPAGSGGSALTVSGGGPSGGASALSPTGGGSDPLSFPYFPLYVLDVTDGVTLYPGVDQVGHVGTTVVLDAQVSGATVSSYDWDTTNLHAFSSSGTSTYQLTFTWPTSNPSNELNSVTLSVTDTSSQIETFTYDFLLLTGTTSGGSGGGGSGGGGGVTWPSSYSPDTVSLNAPEWQSDGVSVNAISGALDAAIPLPSYNPNVSPLALAYNSQAADPQPIIIAENPLSASGSVPSQVSATLTFNGSAGSTYYYGTSTFNPGDIQQIALQASTSPSTGRYAYSMQVVDHGTSLATHTYTGSTDVLNQSSDTLGAGWSVAGLEQITSATGGVILNLGEGGDTLWFASSGGSGGYTSPAGDFSVLTQLPSGGGWTRTLTDGTEYTFNSSGYETASIDRNGLHVTYSYNGFHQLTSVEDPYGGYTTFTYGASGGDLQTIKDPSGRLTTFSYSGGNLEAVEQADDSRVTYTYGSSGQLEEVKDPLGNVVSIVYDSAGRVGTITSPDSATEEFAPFQEQGWTDSGTSGSPAPAMLFAAAAASYTNPNGNTTSVQPDWYGLGTAGVGIDALGDVATNDVNANGLVIDSIDRLNRMDQYSYDTHDNVTTHTFADGTYESYGTYNSFAEPASFTNAAGHTTYYTYDSHGNLTVVQDPMTNLTTMTYTGNGRVQSVTDANDHTTTYQYDSQDCLTTTINADGTTALHAYNSQGDVTSSTDPRGNATTYSYDALDRKMGTTDPLGNRTTYVYDSGGNLLQQQAPTPTGQTARTTTYAYDSMRRMTTETDPLGYQAIVGHDADGNVTTVTDPLGRVTTTVYDALDRPTVVIDPMGGRTTTTYDADGEKLTVTDPMGRVTTTTYNARGWVDTETNPLGFTTTYTYNNVGQETEINAPAPSGGGSSGGNSDPTLYYYDADGRLDQTTDPTYYYFDGVGNKTAVKDPNGNTTSYAYDSMNRLATVTDPLNHTTVLGYNADGQPTTVTDGLGHTTTTLYDADGRATTMISAVGGTTTVTYDAASREVSLTDPVGNTTTWTYNPDDEVTQETDPNSATVTYVYDGDRELTDTTDQDGRRTTYSYNADGDQTGERWLSGGTTLNLITYTYDADNELTGAADNFATLTFTYDSGGHQLSAVTSGPGTGQPHVTLTYTNDPSGNVATVSDSLSSAGIITYTRDPNERVTGIASSYGGTAGPQVTITYDSGGRITAESRTIGGTGLAVNTSLSYDAANRQTSITDQSVSGGTTTPMATYVYSYDQADRVGTMVDAEGTYTYTYDNADEETGVTENGTQVESYSYDLNGNRTGTGYATTVMNEMSTSPGHTYTYDQAGNLISENNGTTITTYTYDYRNRLIGVTQGGTAIATYTYDALGDRIGIDDNGTQTWTVYDGKNPYADFNGSGTLTERYVHGPGVVNGAAVDELLARTSSGGATAWYLTDKLGSVRDIVSSSGTVLDHIVYNSLGNIVSESSASNGDRFKYAGMEYDSVTGQYYDRARYYSPLTGRFEVQDPKRFAAGDTDLYRYVGNDPANATDPSGMDSGGGDDYVPGMSWGQATSVGVGTVTGMMWADMVLKPLLLTGPGGQTAYVIGVLVGGIAGGIYGYMMGSGLGNDIGGVVGGGVSGLFAGFAGATIGAEAGGLWFWTFGPGGLSWSWKGNFASQMEADEARRYAQYWQRGAPRQVTPGTGPVEWQRQSGRTGRMEYSDVAYDQWGRQSYRTDYTDHMRPESHTNPHLHEYQYGPGYGPNGSETTYGLLGPDYPPTNTLEPGGPGVPL